MRPAFSVLFLTTLIGAGQGLAIALVLGQAYALLMGLAVPSGFYVGGSVLALALLGLGLFASFFHLAQPLRAWRAATRWRSSWLSREVLALPAAMGMTVLYGGAHALEMAPALTLALGAGLVAAALALFLCTGMIYACVRFIREWASAWTVVNLLTMGLASGCTLAAAYGALAGSALTPPLVTLALALTVLALAGKLMHLWRNGRVPPRTALKSAIGVHHGQIRQVTQGFLGQSFNTVEFFTPDGAARSARLIRLALLAAFVLPAALLSLGSAPALLAAVAVQYGGLLAERWVFFAQGRHVQNLYYQRMA